MGGLAQINTIALWVRVRRWRVAIHAQVLFRASLPETVTFIEVSNNFLSGGALSRGVSGLGSDAAIFRRRRIGGASAASATATSAPGATCSRTPTAPSRGWRSGCWRLRRTCRRGCASPRAAATATTAAPAAAPARAGTG